MRRTATAVFLCAWLLSGCGGDDPSPSRVPAFSDCIRAGGGRITGDVELAMMDGAALAVMGPGVEASEALLSRCLDAASTS